jgi:chromosome segregation ATPase
LELTQTRHEHIHHFNEQKANLQSLQSNCVELEEKLIKSNQEITRLTKERNDFQKEKVALHQLYTSLKGNESKLAEEAETRLLKARGDLVRQEVLKFKLERVPAKD